MNPKIKRLLAVALCTATIFGLLAMPASAVIQVAASIRGNASKNATFYVQTDSKSGTKSITLKQTKGTLGYDTPFTGNGTHNMYGYYHIYLYKRVNNTWKQTSAIDWKGKQTQRLALDKNSYYMIKLTPYSVKEVGEIYKKSGTNIRWLWVVGSFYWKKLPTWSVSAEKGLTWCYQSYS